MYGYNDREKEKIDIKKYVKWAILGIAALFGVIIILGTFNVMNGEEVGVRVTLGKVSDGVSYGLSTKWPLISEFKIFPTTTQKFEKKSAVYTKDIQAAEVSYTFTYAVVADNAHGLYKKAGMAYETKLIVPVLDGVIKNIIGKWNASDLVGSREVARAEILETLQREIPAEFFTDILFQVIDIDYSDTFEKSIEEKVMAEQEALKAQNRTVQIEEEGKQKVIQAKASADAAIAEAEGNARAMDIEGKALARNPQVIRLRELDVQQKLSESAAHWQTVILSADQSKSMLNIGNGK